jgi:hypothetical protein
MMLHYTIHLLPIDYTSTSISLVIHSYTMSTAMDVDQTVTEKKPRFEVKKVSSQESCTR